MLEKGFAATSIDELVVAAGITKSGFFYHFKDKNELARAILQRYLDRDRVILDELFARADELNDDPLHGMLIALKLYAEMMADLPTTHPGCLAAAFCYQDQLFDREIRALNASGMLDWRTRFRARFEAISERYPPRLPVSLDALSDMVTTLVEGGIILSRLLKEKTILPGQLLEFRNYVRLVFDPKLGEAP